jgi:hypothetical protein
MNVPTCTGFQQSKKFMIPKHPYVRSKKLLRLVASLDCQLCGSGHFVQAAHTNWGGGKGRGIKADDNLVAALCMSCHHDIDQGAKWSKKERQQAWVVAHMKTVQQLTDANQWPVDVPLPSEAELTRLIDSCQN